MFSSVRILLLLSPFLLFVFAALCSGAETVITVPLQVREVSSGEANRVNRTIRCVDGVDKVIPFATATGRIIFRAESDLVRFDLDGDGTMDTDSESIAGEIKIPITLAGRPYAYPIKVGKIEGWEHRGRKGINVSVTPSIFLEGQLNGTTVAIRDRHFDGVFGDLYDEVLLAGGRGYNFVEPLMMEGAVWNMSIRNAGEALVLTPYRGKTGKVLFCPTIERLRATITLHSKQDKYFFDHTVMSGDEMTVPAGTYSFIVWLYSEAGGGEKDPSLFGICSRSVNVGRVPQRIEFGPPFAMEVSAAKEKGGDGITLSRVSLIGQSGAKFRAAVGHEKADSLTCYLRAGDKTHKPIRLKYG